MATKARKAASAPRAELLEKEPTALHTDFVEYIKSETGYEPDEKSVQLATILRMDFQRSEGNQARLRANKEAKEAAAREREERRAAREAAKAEKATAKAAKSTEKAPAKKTAAKKTAAAKETAAPAKKAPARRRAAKKAPVETF